MGVSVGSPGEAKAEPNVVPFCDVLLVLLIIFMIVTPMIISGVSVRLPEAINTVNQPEPSQMIFVGIRIDEVTKKPRYYLSVKGKIEEIKILDDLKPRLDEALANEEKRIVYLRADKDIEFGVIAEVLEKIRAAGVEVLGILTEKEAAEE